MSLGQDDFVGVKIAMRAVRASECLSSCKILSNRLAEEIQNEQRPRVIRRVRNSDEEEMENSVSGSN